MYLCRSEAGRAGKGEPLIAVSFDCCIAAKVSSFPRTFHWTFEHLNIWLSTWTFYRTFEHVTEHLNNWQNIWTIDRTFEHFNEHLNFWTYDRTFAHLTEHLNIWQNMWLDRRKGFLFSQNSATDPSHEDARLKYGESWRNSGYLCEFQPIYVLRNPIKSNPMLQQAGNGNRQFLAATM